MPEVWKRECTRHISVHTLIESITGRSPGKGIRFFMEKGGGELSRTGTDTKDGRQSRAFAIMLSRFHMLELL